MLPIISKRLQLGFLCYQKKRVWKFEIQWVLLKMKINLHPKVIQTVIKTYCKEYQNKVNEVEVWMAFYF